MYSYKTKGVCSREIQFDVENDIIKEVRFIGGCRVILRELQLLLRDVILMK